MDLQLKGKRALVTGSTSGIGEAIARTLAAEGAAVVIHGRSEQSAHRVCSEIRAAGGLVAVALGDLSDDAQAASVAKQAQTAFGGGIDILVNNAGQFPERAWLDVSADQWADLFNQNVFSMVRVIRELVPGMKTRGWGRVVFMASGAGTMPLLNLPDYSVTKAANLNMAVGLAKALANTGITVNAVSPGLILTPGVEEMLRGMAKQLQVPYDEAEMEKRAVAGFAANPMGRLGRPQDIADAVAFLASPRASYINGANLRIDGGTLPTVN